MSNISFTPIVDGTTSAASQVNTPLSTIYDDYNGNITDANIATGAAIAGSKISLVSIANPYKFSVYRNAALTSTTSFAVVQFDTKVFDTGTNVDIVTHKGRFTAPVAGFYHFSSSVGSTTSTNVIEGIGLYVNGVQKKLGTMGDPSQVVSSGFKCHVSGILQLAATDYVEVYFIAGSGSTIEVGQANCWFDGHFVSAT